MSMVFAALKGPRYDRRIDCATTASRSLDRQRPLENWFGSRRSARPFSGRDDPRCPHKKTAGRVARLFTCIECLASE
jgi:hypothetical protein